MTGVGSTTDPYVVSASAGAFTAADTSTIDHTLSGSGTLANPYILTSTVKVSPTAPGNLITTLGDGLAVTCEDVQDCIGQALDDGLVYDDAANQIRARLSTDAGNAMVFGTDGGLYSGGGPGGGLTFVSTTDDQCIDFSGNGTALQPLTAAPVVAPVAGNLLSCAAGGLRALLTVGACGLSGTGAVGSPLAVKTVAWPFACDVTAQAGGVYCDANGTLRSDPPSHFYFQQDSVSTSYPNLAVPAALDTLIEDRSLLVTNPDPCRDAIVILETELDVDFNLPSGGGAAAMGMGVDETFYTRNSGSTTSNDIHTQTTKVFDSNPILPPGGNFNTILGVRMGRGAGGATYNRIQTNIRAFIFAL